jgi:hypothetical protein
VDLKVIVGIPALIQTSMTFAATPFDLRNFNAGVVFECSDFLIMYNCKTFAITGS